jgi:hypothetical protein
MGFSRGEFDALASERFGVGDDGVSVWRHDIIIAPLLWIYPLQIVVLVT